jgi:hypothetical protein
MPLLIATCHMLHDKVIINATCQDVIIATCHMPHATCHTLLHATCHMLADATLTLLMLHAYMLHTLHNVTCHMPHATCWHVPHATRYMPHATCRCHMPYMMRYMPHTLHCHYVEAVIDAFTCHVTCHMLTLRQVDALHAGYYMPHCHMPLIMCHTPHAVT